MSQRQLARALAGDDAADRQVENMRRQIARYMNDESAPEPERAALISSLLGKPADFFVDAIVPRARVADELRRLAGDFEALRLAIEAAAAAEGAASGDRSIGRRLESLEAQVEHQGKEMTKALRGATRRLARIEELLEPPARAQARRAR
jgi:HAMP domain-containing protein